MADQGRLIRVGESGEHAAEFAGHVAACPFCARSAYTGNTHTPTGVVMFNLIEELFAPGRKHTEEERNRLELTLNETGSNDPGKGPIDLDSGHVVIRPREGG
ncbi:hypothetical protein IGW14_11945 [Streptomyces hygroscopicus subsp. hygroscopicus]|uniref:Uncharacterized protein n=1 Tax=Streptomyces demainii TaxID=588122 RepID=A0ABT9KZG5_9ACTN|nr:MULTISPECIES: DUF6191 domain-containing protein [Streptomyces]MBW8088726.1 hypothetical protein [Streptomyces hygroscopicus subsp. hygroscopicus]MDP9613759.1 hypothetical protein [Streptomyces demainii]